MYKRQSPITEEIKIVETGLVGSLTVVAGYNMRVDATTESITLTPILGSGLGTQCDELERYPSEAAAYPGEMLSGGPRCSELVYSINGVKPNDNGEFVISGAAGITTDNTTPNVLNISADITNTTFCST